MSFFRVYSPKSLYRRTLVLVNVIFKTPPSVSADPSSYFRATIEAHRQISSDLSSVFPVSESSSASVAISEVFKSLVDLEQILFGTKSDFKISVEGCCLYTDSLTARLRSNDSCSIH
jgi:hypothetical protein